MSMEITSDNRYVVPPGNAVQVPAGNAVQMGPSSDFSAASDPRRAEGSGGLGTYGFRVHNGPRAW